MKPIMLVFALLWIPAMAEPTGFAERMPYASGAAIIEPAAGGEYVHAESARDTRLHTPPLMTTPPERQTYAFFSPDEEQALLRYRDQQPVKRLAVDGAPARGRHRATAGGFDWPKVIVRADGICVPELASSGSADWRDHLVCHPGRAVR